jgi:hypothetical protein
MSVELSASNPHLDWMFKDPHGSKAFCSDLSEATDKAYHQAISLLLDQSQAVMPVQDWYWEVCKDLLSSSRPFSCKMEELIIRGVTSRGCFMGDHGAKTVLTLSGMYALAGMKFPRLSRLVGDDQATVCQNAELAGSIYRSRLESLGYVLSEPDTFVSRTVFFAEEGFDIPNDIRTTTEVWLSRKGRSRLPFHDTPKVKILSDVGKDIGLFSETAIGKITLLAVRMEQTGRTFREGLFHLASWIQDICISLLFRKEFIYFPRFLVQTGKPPLFGSKENVQSFLRMHRNGRLQGHYADIMESSLQRTPSNEAQYIVQSFFTHGANDDSIRIVKREFPKSDFESHRILTNLSVKGFEPFLVHRLSKKVISESEIVAKITEREILLGEHPEVKKLTVKNLARGQRPLTDELLAEFISLWISNSKILRLRKEESYYDREAVEELLGNTHPLRVGRILKQLDDGEYNPELCTEHDREIEKLYNWVKSNPQRLDDIPRALIRDDLLVLSETHITMPRLLIVSNDIELVNCFTNLRSINWRQQRETFHVSVETWILADLKTALFEPDEVFVDEGSLDGYLDNLEKENREIPDPDGKDITNRCRLVRPSGRLHLPTEVMELNRLRGDLQPVSER